MKIISGPESIQGSKEWHEFRKTHVMASMAPTIMGVGYDTPYSLWRQLLDLDPPKEKTDAMQRGIDLEPEALSCASKIIGCEFNKVVALSGQYDWLGASFDGMSKAGTIIEIKIPYRTQDASVWFEKNQDMYYSQFQVQMVVSGEDHCHVFVYMGNDDGKFFTVDRDDSYIDKMIPKLKAFYDCVMSLNPPELTDRDYVERQDEEWNMHANAYHYLKESLKNTEKALDQAREKLIELSNGQPSKGAGVTLSKIVSKGKVDYAKIVADLNIDVEPYRKQQTESWRLNYEM